MDNALTYSDQVSSAVVSRISNNIWIKHEGALVELEPTKIADLPKDLIEHVRGRELEDVRCQSISNCPI